MASTYSPALRLELMATGDQSGTWGDTTNTNLGTLLEQAITGYLSVAQGDTANLTLTTTNGASDQARNAVIRVTGALTATRNVVVQTAAKLYTIANDTTGGFSIVVKTAAGTGVSIPPGAMADVYSNGTNVIQGANYWTGQIGGATWLDAGATFGPEFDAFRDSASPAVSDVNARYTFSARSSTGVKRRMAYIEQSTIDPTNASEDAAIDFYAMVAGTPTRIASIGPNLSLAAIGQIAFPATQNPSSNANTLDDYEEGTWTPTITYASGSIGAVTVNSANYTKIGNRVLFDISAQIVTATGSGLLRVTLPVTPVSSAAASGSNNASGGVLSAQIISGDHLYAASSTGGTATTATQLILLGGEYRTA